MIVSRRRACRSSMWSAYAGNFSAPCSAYIGKLFELVGRRHQRRAPGGHGLDQVGGQAGAVLDAVDARLDQPGQHRLAEAVGGDPRAVLVGGGDRRRRTPRRGTTARGRPSSREIQSPTSFTQPSPACASWATYAVRSSGSISWAKLRM